jgi:hypothetical protein
LEGRGRQISEFEASLVYKVSSRTARATQRNPVQKKKKLNSSYEKVVTLGRKKRKIILKRDIKDIFLFLNNYLFEKSDDLGGNVVSSL